jgi:hypothetical protein
MALGPGEEHPGEIEEGIGAVSGLDLACDADGATLVRKKFNGDIGRLSRGPIVGILPARSIGTTVAGGAASAVIGTALRAIGTFGIRLAGGAGSIAPGTAIIAAAGIAARLGIIAWTASGALSTGPAAAIVLTAAAPEVAPETTAGAAIVIAALVVRVRILAGWLLEPVGHKLEVKVRGEIRHGVIE